MVTVKGRYVFDKGRIDDERFEYTGFTFTSNGQTFYGIKLEFVPPLSLYYMNQDGTYTQVAFQDGNWDTNWDYGDGYKTIDFGDGAEVPEHLRDWLDWSATWQVVTLKAGTYRFNDNLNFDKLAPYGVLTLDEILSYQNNDLNYIPITFEDDGTVYLVPILVFYTDRLSGVKQVVLTTTPQNSDDTHTIYQEVYGVSSAPPIVNETSNLDVHISNDFEVNDYIASWFIDNTNYNKVNAPKMTLKAGTYTFNAELKPINSTPMTFEDAYEFVLNNYIDVTPITFDITLTAISAAFHIVDGNLDVVILGAMCSVDSDTTPEPFLEGLYINGTVANGGTYSHQWLPIDNIRTYTIPTDIEVDNIFGTWFIANTNYNEVNTPAPALATIEYNGSTIAKLNAGEKATLPCKDLPMASDVVVKINPCPNDHVIEVTNLPEIGEEGAIYKLSQGFSDILIYEGSWIQVVEYYNKYGLSASTHTIPTKTTENVKISSEENGLHFYFIEDENDIFAYGDLEGTGSNDWVSPSVVFNGLTYGGMVTDISQATNTSCYYALGGGSSSYYQYAEPSFDEYYVNFLGQLLPIKALLPGAQYYYVKTRPTENINITDGESGAFHVYYIADEGCISTYDGSEWEDNEVTVVHSEAEINPSNGSAWVLISEGWKKLITPKGMMVISTEGVTNVTNVSAVHVSVTSGTESITSNGEYNIASKKYVSVNVPFIIDVNKLPTSNVNYRAAYRMDDKLYICQRNYTGTWKFNDRLSGLQDLYSSYPMCNFTCDGTEYTNMSVMYDNWDYYLSYGDASSFSGAVYNDTNGWADEVYKTINITSTELDSELRSFLDINATQISQNTIGAWDEYAPPPYIIPVDELPTDNINADMMYECGDKLYRYEPDTSAICGTWVLNDTLTGFPNVVGENVVYELDFVCGTTAYTAIKLANENSTTGAGAMTTVGEAAYYVDTLGANAAAYLNGSMTLMGSTTTYTGWDLSTVANRNIVVNTEPSSETADWLRANATQVDHGGYSWVEYTSEPPVIEVDELPASDIDVDAVYSCDSKLYRHELNTSAIRGTWVLNDNIDFSTTFGEQSSPPYGIKLAYSSNGYKLIGIAALPNSQSIWYYTSDTNNYIAYKNGAWNGGWKEITITEEPTDTSFIEWLRMNATQTGYVREWVEYTPTPTPITFTYGTDTYFANDGMTWGDWLSTVFNTTAWHKQTITVNGNDVKAILVGSYSSELYPITDADGNIVQTTDTIISGHAYQVISVTADKSFYIDHENDDNFTTYYAPEGMTWAEYVEEVNKADLQIIDGSVYSSDGTKLLFDTEGAPVPSTEAIVAGAHYTLVTV